MSLTKLLGQAIQAREGYEPTNVTDAPPVPLGLLGSQKMSTSQTLLGRVEHLEFELHERLKRQSELESQLASFLEDLRGRLERLERTLGF